MDYKQEIIASIKENHGVFGLLSENQEVTLILL